MGDLSDFLRGQTVGERLAGASVTKTATLLAVSRAAVSRVVIAYTNQGKTSSADSNSGRKPKRSERNRRTLKRIVSKNHIELLQQRWQQNSIVILKTLFPQKQSDESFSNPTSMVELQLLTLWLLKAALKCEKRLCDDHKTWTYDDWNYVIWSGDRP